MNQTDNKKSVWIRRGIVIGFVMIIIFAKVSSLTNKRVSDNEFRNGSGIQIEALDQTQIQNLHKLCKVWGFVKYYHPKVIKPTINWDYELFRVMPKVLGAKSSVELDQILYDWVSGLGEVREGVYDGEGKEVSISPELEWIRDKQYVSGELSDLLVKISKTYISQRQKAYVNFTRGSEYAEFDNEQPYPDMKYDDAGYKLLGLFRYWNIVAYYYPYRTIIGEDWDAVLTEFIPKFAECKDELGYKLAVSELTTKIHDSHGWVVDHRGVLKQYWGINRAPLTFDFIENKIVVTKILEKYQAECPVQVGDVVLKINGEELSEVIKEKSRYISFSRDNAFVNGLQSRLLNTSEEQMALTIERNGKVQEETVKCYSSIDFSEPNQESHKLLEGNIGYINPGALEKGEIGTIMKRFMNTKGLIVDLRNYPSDFIVYSLGKYLMPEPVAFAKAAVANQAVPGEFVSDHALEVGSDNPNYYKGKVILIINGNTQSQPEFTAMAFRKAPLAQIVGSPSIGADGDIIRFSLPGALETTMTGLGIYYPDKSETQRVGITPDIFIEPTIQGVREGRDELLEKAIEVINR